MATNTSKTQLEQAFNVLDAVYSLKLKTDETIKSFVLENLEKFIAEHQENYIGPSGIPGIQGPRGFDGPKGLTGLSITKVESRIVGNSPHLVILRSDGLEFDCGEYLGPQGDRGPQGLPGKDGEKGEDGLRGSEGPRGKASAIHYIKVEKDLNNDTANLIIKYDSGEFPIEKNLGNVIGPRGPRGQRGEQGIQGIQGLVGPKGDRGERGPIGLMGPMGLRGETGTPGSSVKFYGEWQKGIKYPVGAMVSYFGALYIADLPPVGNPAQDSSWLLMVSSQTSKGGGNVPAATTLSLSPWAPFTVYQPNTMVYWTDNRLYISAVLNTSTVSFKDDYNNGLWISASDINKKMSIGNGVTNQLIPALQFIPTEITVAFVDILTMRSSSTVPAAFYKVTLTLVWDGTQWVKNESSKNYFPGTPDNITFGISTEAITNKCLVTYTTPLLAGVYDAAFSKMTMNIRSMI